MLIVINITLPFFLIIFLGFFLKKINFLNHEKTTFLSKFAFFILMPVMMFSNLYSSVSSDIWNYSFIIRYELITIVIFIFALPLSRLINSNKTNAGLLGLNMAYPNYGYIGIPMCLVAFGSKASMPLALILFADTLVLLGSTAFLIALTGKQQSILVVLRNLFKNIFLNPLIISVILGILFGMSGFNLYTPIYDFIKILGSSAAPVALIALGGSLSIKKLSKNKKMFSIVLSNKLLLHPILMASIFIIWPEEEPVWMQTAILCACLPVAANVFVIANHYQTMENESANNIVLTTVFSTITVPITLFIILNYLNI